MTIGLQYDLGALRKTVDDMLLKSADRTSFNKAEIQDFCLDLRNEIARLEDWVETAAELGFERWILSKLSASTARTPSNTTPFAAQSREDPVPYSFPASTTSGTPSCWYRTAAS